MSVLSDLLTALLQEKKLSLGQLSQGCAFDRATLYHYFSGKRPLKNRAHLDTICSAMHLTPKERSRIEEAYQITCLGQNVYWRRKKMQELLQSLDSIHDELPPQTLPLPALPKSAGLLHGNLDISRTVSAIISRAYRLGQPVDILLQPEHMELLEMLRFVGSTPSETVLRHIICLESDASNGQIHNIKLTRRILQYGMATQNYTPLYYYGNSAERFNASALFPGLIVTPDVALQLTWDNKSAILHTDPDIIDFFQSRFSEIAEQCKPILFCCNNAQDSLILSVEVPNRFCSGRMFSMGGGLCSGMFLTEEMIRTYLNPQLPDYETIVNFATKAAADALSYKKSCHAQHLISTEAVESFLQTGYLPEFPQIYWRTPLSKKHRRYFLQKNLEACREGWYRIRLCHRGHAIPGPQWSIGFWQGEALLLQHCVNDRSRTFLLQEPGLLAAAADYFESILDSDVLYSEAETMAQLQHWIDTLEA